MNTYRIVTTREGHRLFQWLIMAIEHDSVRPVLQCVLKKNGVLLTANGFQMHVLRLIDDVLLELLGLRDAPDGVYSILIDPSENDIVLGETGLQFPDVGIILEQIKSAKPAFSVFAGRVVSSVASRTIRGDGCWRVLLSSRDGTNGLTFPTLWQCGDGIRVAIVMPAGNMGDWSYPDWVFRSLEQGVDASTRGVSEP